jgi:hypothetical protein
MVIPSKVQFSQENDRIRSKSKLKCHRQDAASHDSAPIRNSEKIDHGAT